jgi:DNA-binding transcriptional LysR family regulator
VFEIDSAAALMARDVDLALVTRPETEAGIEVVLSHPLAVAGAVAENHPKSGGRLTLSEIADHALILPREGTGLRAALDGALRKARIVPRQSHIVPVGALGLVAGPVPDLRPFLVAPGATAGPKVELSALRVPAVQLTVLRRNAGVLPRAAALFLAVLHRGLDA